MIRRSRSLFAALAPAALVAGGCTLPGTGIPEELPPLKDMEEPLTLFEEPDDEEARRDLARGTFSGVYVADSRGSLDALLGEPEGVLVERVVENSPGALARVRAGDLLIEATVQGEPTVPLAWPSEWREIELGSPPGSEVDLLLDRAGQDFRTRLTLIERAGPADRRESARFREEERAGVVVRTATEVEARAAGLAPGAGAVIVGLSARSPFRAAGLRYGDLLVEVDGQELADPRVLIDRIRSAGKRDKLKVTYVRDGERQTTRTHVSSRVREIRELGIWPLYRFERDRGKAETSVLFGLFSMESTEAAWRVRLFWLIRFGGGSADRLREVSS